MISQNMEKYLSFLLFFQFGLFKNLNHVGKIMLSHANALKDRNLEEFEKHVFLVRFDKGFVKLVCF